MALALLVPAFIALAPASRWEPVTLFATLVAVALISYFGAVALKTTNTLDASFVAALIGVAFLGPLPAAVIWAATEIGAIIPERRRLDAFLANVASFGWAALVGSVVLAATVSGTPLDAPPAGAYVAVAVAGVAMILVNFFVGALLIDVVRDRRGLVVGDLLEPAPATLAMIALGAVAAFAYQHVGLLALGGFAAAASVPQTLLPLLLRSRPVAELSHPQAVALYADTIGHVMSVGRKTRQVLRDAAPYLRERPLKTSGDLLSDHSTRHRLALVEAVIYHGEHWDGKHGSPGAVGGELIPLTSRVLAVADAWAGLTAADSPGLTHAQALRQLESKSAMHFDPAVIRAAVTVIRDERLGFSGQVACEPRLHRVPMPQQVRRALAKLASAAPAIGQPGALDPAPVEVSLSGYRR